MRDTFRKDFTRRDFLNTSLLGAGAALLRLPSPINLMLPLKSGWDGYGGTGDYSESNGNTLEAVKLFEALRKGRFERIPKGASDTGEEYDLVVIGGGISGLAAANEFRKAAPDGKKCLVLESHRMFGGTAKRNEFVVDGYRITGPQGSNSFGDINRPDTPGYEIYEELGIPHEFRYASMPDKYRQLEFDRTNFGFRLWFDSPSVGYFFKGRRAGDSGKWVNNIWRNKLRGTPFKPLAKKDLGSWMLNGKIGEGVDMSMRRLDSMTYEDYLEKILGLSGSVARYADPVIASALGLGSDAVSAYAAYRLSFPGFGTFKGGRSLVSSHWHSFPGGNDGFSRHFVKALIPAAIGGTGTFDDIMVSPIRFEELDRSGNKIRLRLGAMAVRVEHEGSPDKSGHVLVSYVKGGRTYRLRAQAAVVASGSHMSRLIVKDLADELRRSMGGFLHAPMLVINVALNNWRFLYELGFTACRWFEGFGDMCNIRQPMVVGGYVPPLSPDKPNVLTFYVSFHNPGVKAARQCDMGRTELLTTTFADYERKILKHMNVMFGRSGFKPEMDVAGIVLNRWTHGYIVPQPGFFTSRRGNPPARDVVMQGFGRISFGHAELQGNQNWVGAVIEGQRAFWQIRPYL